MRSLIGQTRCVLWERDAKPQQDGTLLWRGYTDNYIKVYCRSKKSLFNQLTKARVLAYDLDHGLCVEVP